MIQRFPANVIGRCDAVVSDGHVYAVATDPVCADGIAAQTRNTLAELDRLLGNAGAGKSGLIQATVYLSDITAKPEMDAVWRDWIGPQDNWPQRACVGVGLDGGCLIEIVVIAKVDQR